MLDQIEERVVLVGHSLGGLTISQTAEYRPDKIKTLVYLTALMLRPGEAMMPVASRDPETVRAGLQRDSWTVSEDLGTVIFHEDSLKARFFSDCSDGDTAWAKSMLVPQPSGPLMDPMNTTEESFGRVPKVYIECLRDGALLLPQQREMQANVSCERILSLDTGHCSFLAAPEELVRHLVSI